MNEDQLNERRYENYCCIYLLIIAMGYIGCAVWAICLFKL